MTTLGGVLPQVGQEIPCSSYAVNVPLQIKKKLAVNPVC